MPILNFNNLMGSPLGMAGLGLLMQPTRSYHPINPMTGIAQGMMAAGQYRQNEMQNAIQQQRAEMEQQRLQFQLEDSLRKREQEAAAQAEADRLRAAQEAYMAGRPPEEQALAAAMGLPAYMAALGKQHFAEPQALPAAQQNYERAVKDGFEGTFMDYQVAMANAKRPTTSITNNMVMDKPLSGSEARSMIGPDGKPPPIGTTLNQAREAGYRYKDETLNESQSNATMFYSRAKEMDAALSSSNYNPTGVQAAFDRMASGPALTNWMASGEGQAYINQGKNFVAAILRKESGAAITNDEWTMGQQLYVDMPGDSAELRAQKAQNRKIAIEGIKVAAGPGVGRIGTPMSEAEIAPSRDVDALLEKYK